MNHAPRNLVAPLLGGLLWGGIVLVPASSAWTTEPEKAAAPASSPQRAAVEGVLGKMRDAVLAGDGAAYLAHVVPASGALADAIFRKEQENWAKDLKDHVPAEFELAIDDSGLAPVFAPGRADFDLKMTWRYSPPEADAKPPTATRGSRRSRNVTIPVVFRFDDSRPDGGWFFAGEKWIEIEGDQESAVRAKCAPGLEKAARDVVAVFPDVRRHVEDGFELKVPRVQEVKLYSSMRHLQASIYLSYVDGLGGWNEPGESIKVLGSAATGKDELRTLLAHEFGHVATFEMGPQSNDMPWWILEGMAELSSQDFQPGLWKTTDRMVRDWARSDQLAKWEDLADFRTVPSRKHIFVYRQGHHMCGYISDRFGRAARNAWLRSMSQGRSIDEATREALHLASFKELDEQWRASLVEEKPGKAKGEDHQE